MRRGRRRGVGTRLVQLSGPGPGPGSGHTEVCIGVSTPSSEDLFVEHFSSVQSCDLWKRRLHRWFSALTLKQWPGLHRMSATLMASIDVPQCLRARTKSKLFFIGHRIAMLCEKGIPSQQNSAEGLRGGLQSPSPPGSIVPGCFVRAILNWPFNPCPRLGSTSFCVATYPTRSRQEAATNSH